MSSKSAKKATRRNSKSRSRASSTTSSLAEESQVPTWQNPANDVSIRQRGVIRIAAIIEKGLGDKQRDVQREQRVTHALERLCYEHARTRPEYEDESMFRILLHRMAAEKAKRRRGRQWSDRNPQQQISLLEILGSDNDDDENNQGAANFVASLGGDFAQLAGTSQQNFFNFEEHMDDDIQIPPPPQAQLPNQQSRHHRRGSSGSTLNSLFNRSNRYSRTNEDLKVDPNANSSDSSAQAPQPERRSKLSLKVETVHTDEQETFGVQTLTVQDNTSKAGDDEQYNEQFSSGSASPTGLPFPSYGYPMDLDFTIAHVGSSQNGGMNRSPNNLFLQTPFPGSDPQSGGGSLQFESALRGPSSGNRHFFPRDSPDHYVPNVKARDSSQFYDPRYATETVGRKSRSHSDSRLPRFAVEGTKNTNSTDQPVGILSYREPEEDLSPTTSVEAGREDCSEDRDERDFFSSHGLGSGNSAVSIAEGVNARHRTRQRTPRRRSAVTESLASTISSAAMLGQWHLQQQQQQEGQRKEGFRGN